MTKCLICNKDSKVISYNITFKKKIDVKYCKLCELYYLGNLPTQKFLDKYYSNEYFDDVCSSKILSRLKTQFTKIRSYSQYKYIIKKAKKGSILELGSADGTFLSIFKKNGWEVRGLEYNDFMIKKANDNYGINLEKKTIFEINGEYDVVAFPHVIEHLLEPEKILKHCKKLLKPDGVVFIEVPYSPSPKEVNGVELRDYLTTAHLYDFRPKSLSKLTEKSGLKNVCLDRFYYNIPFNIKHKVVGDALMKAKLPLNNIIIIGLTVSNLVLRFLLKFDPMRKISLKRKWQGLGDYFRVILR